MDDTNDNFGLSRRRMLGGLGMIGVASAGAGLGTTAYFSDEESFTENTLTAGSLDLYVHVDYSEDQGDFAQWSTPSGTYVQGGVVGEDVNGNGAVAPGEPLSIQVVDLKPGDSGEGEFCFSIVDNPAYMWMCGELTANDENTVTEPEADSANENNAETDTDTDGDGELADAMEVTLSYCEDGEVGTEIISGSLGEVMAALQAGVPLYGDGNPDAPVANRPAFDGVETPFDDEEPNIDETCVCFEWEVPTEVGNEIQSDSVTFDFEFYAEQERHNDGTNNPCADESYAADYVNPDGITQPIPDGVARVDVSYGDDQVVYGITFDEPDGSPYSLADPNFAVANFSMPFDLDDDGIYDYQVAWNAEGGDDFLYSAVESGPNWEKDTSTGWSSVPASITAVKFGSQAVIAVPRSDLETSGNDYVFGFGASAGGQAPSVGIPMGGPYSSSDNWTSSENGQNATLQ
ncbi:SipW-dependent-type signal peptide-containing protein [Halorubrum sp. F4]|uniref:SipW-dependent-type signal peptide-containing protein n=1 Tax=Halorubrum sp. F4 TaxID=2989715 RepID=UPI00248130BA|nr:SipW-dependent-type signal peptide-containing protein [Halorubrum sp. F4]